jgi:hypothetical protein
MKKLYILNIVLLYFCFNAKAEYGSQVPLVFQPYTGLSLFTGPENTSAMYQLGFKYTPPGLPFYFSAENNIYSRGSDYNWPGYGSYRYRRSINDFGLSAGMNIFRRSLFTAALGLRYNFVNVSGKLISGNPEVRDQILEYSASYESLSILIHLNYRINNKFSAYLNYHFLSFSNNSNISVPGFGVAYNIADLSL